MSLKEGKRINRYSNSFKLLVVQEMESGGCLADVKRKYGIPGGSTVQGWVRHFGKHHLLNKVVRIETMNEKDRLKQLEEENRRLKLKLAETYMAKDCLEEVIKLANEEYRTDLKKSFGTTSPTASKDDTV